MFLSLVSFEVCMRSKPLDPVALEEASEVLADSFSTYKLNEIMFQGVGDVSTLMREQALMNLQTFNHKGWVRILDGDPRAMVLGYMRSEHSRVYELRHKMGIVLKVMRMLSKEQRKVMRGNIKRVKKALDMKWAYKEIPGDFYYVKIVAVDEGLRGTGAFRRLMEPLFAFCDDEGLPMALETHDERNVSIYEHFGFRTVRVLEPEGVGLKQYCMVRPPSG